MQKKIVIEEAHSFKDFITIYDMAKMLGINSNLAAITKNREWIVIALNSIPNIRKCEKADINENNINSKRKDYLYHGEDVKKFVEKHISRSEAISLLSLSDATFNKYIKQYNFPVYIFAQSNELKYYHRAHIEELHNKFFFDKRKYFSIYKFAEEYLRNNIGPSFIWRLKANIEKLPKGRITPKKLDKRYYDEYSKRYVGVIYSRKEVETFFEMHVSKQYVLENLYKIASEKTIYKYYNLSKIIECRLGNQQDTIFIAKKDYHKLEKTIDAFKHEGESTVKGIVTIYGKDYYTRSGAMSKLTMSKEGIKQCEQNNLLIISENFKNENYYESLQIINLYNKQQKILKKYEIYYYRISEIRSKYSKYFATAITKHKTTIYKVERLSIPFLIKPFYYETSQYVYLKTDVDFYWDGFNLVSQLHNICIEDHYEDFVYKVEEVCKVEFNENQEITKEMWYDYVKSFLLKTRNNDKKAIIITYAKCTSYIIKAFKKEIYLYSVRDINFLFLNEQNKIPNSYQKEFYNFLKKVSEVFVSQDKKLQININDLNNPYDYEKNTESDYSIYSLQEYHKLYNYVNEIEFHKFRAINDVEKFVTTKNIYRFKKFDSCWLYILVQLTNNWRHSTVITQIPRIDLNNTRITDLTWLKNNLITIDEANDIILQIGRYVTKINKTNVRAEGIFEIGEPLKIAFATAASICEIRTRITDNSSPILIKLSNGKDILNTNFKRNRNPHKVFFENFSRDFYFENRKMNRTLATLIYSVLNFLGKGVAEAQLSRYHLDQWTTINHYIKLSDEQVAALTNQLFERSSLGYVTQLMTNILFGVSLDKDVETKKMVSLSNKFGGAMKIEATAGLVNTLTKQRAEVDEYIKKLSLKELQNLYQNSMCGNLPSKKKYYQCIYRNCKYEEIKENPPCEGCPAAIINVYALSQIMDNYINLMLEICKNFNDSPTGEKRKMANHLYMFNQLVIEARKKFGRKVVDSFAEGGTEKIEYLGQLLETKNIHQYITFDF